MLAEGLEDAGFAVAESPDVADARARLEGFAYDALVVDLTLPDGDGMQLLDRGARALPGHPRHRRHRIRWDRRGGEGDPPAAPSIF